MAKKISQSTIDTFRRKIIERRNNITTIETPKSHAILIKMNSEYEKEMNQLCNEYRIKDPLKLFVAISYSFLSKYELKNKLKLDDSDLDFCIKVIKIINKFKNAEIESKRVAAEEELERLKVLETKLVNYNALAELGQVDDEFVEELKALLG